MKPVAMQCTKLSVWHRKIWELTQVLLPLVNIPKLLDIPTHQSSPSLAVACKNTKKNHNWSSNF